MEKRKNLKIIPDGDLHKARTRARKINTGFKYFDNNETLFEVVEKLYPFSKKLDKFNDQLPKTLKELYIEAEKESLREIYPSFTEWHYPSNFGFVNRVSGHDVQLKALYITYVIWRDTEGNLWRKALKLEQPRLSEKKFNEFLERKYIELISQGINDARYLEFLNELTLNEPPAGNPKAQAASQQSEGRNLKDIWLKGAAHYMKVFSFLEQNNEDIDRPFIVAGRWAAEQVYLRAFIDVCKKHSLIETVSLKTVHLESILNNTFETKLKGSDAFKGFGRGKSPATDYHLKVFKFLPLA